MDHNTTTKLLSNNWTSVVKKLENYFANIQIPAKGQVKNQVSFFLSNLRWTIPEKEEQGRILIAYADQIVYELEAEVCIKSLLKTAFLKLYEVNYEIELIPIGEILK